MIEVTVNVDTSRIVAKLEHVSHVGDAMKPAIVRAADRVRAEVSEYAPATAANMPSPGHTHYVRGTGPVYVRKTDGRHTVRKTSQMLNRKWSTKYRFTATEAEAVIGNSASYAPYVHDNRKQARFHAARGWRTAQGTIVKLREVIRDDFEQAVRQWLIRG